MSATKIKKIEEKREALITLYLKNDEEIDYAYNQDKSNVIIQNNRLLVGTVEKIKNDLLNLETQQIQENPEDKEEDVEDKEDEEEFDDEEEELD